LLYTGHAVVDHLPELFHLITTFYGQMICEYMQNRIEHARKNGLDEEKASKVEDFEVLREAIGLNKEVFEMGLNWCFTLGFISHDLPAPLAD
jgi:hypothetical protein